VVGRNAIHILRAGVVSQAASVECAPVQAHTQIAGA
jgi:hypothetical protein